MSKIKFHVSIDPPKSTHQGSARAMINRKTGKPFIGKPKGSAGKQASKLLTLLFKGHRPKQPLEGPLKLDVLWCYKWRKRETKKNIAQGMMLCDTVPDCDNIAKMVQDVLEDLGFYKNDGQIAWLSFKKCWTDTGGITITLEELK